MRHGGNLVCLRVNFRALLSGLWMDISRLVRESAPFAIKVLWSCLIIAPTAWVLMTSVSVVVPTSSSEFASWIQAFGSIAAILGALHVSHSQRVHERLAKEKEEAEHVARIRAIFRKAAESQCNQLKFLCEKMQMTKVTGSPEYMREYFSLGLNLHWESNLFTFNDFSVVEQARCNLIMINELKAGAEYAKRVCDYYLRDVKKKLDLARSLDQLRHHHAMAMSVVGVFDVQEKAMDRSDRI